MNNKCSKWLTTYCNRRLLVIFMLGFSSGLPLALISGTLQAWFKTNGASIVLIGFISLIGQPHAYKFFWAPLLDRFSLLSCLDRRRGWMLAMQLAITIAIILMSLFNPNSIVQIFNFNLPILLLLGLMLSFFSATQDIAVDAYRVDVLKHDERGLGAALSIEGYRIAMIASGGFALILADRIGWQLTYLCMAGLMCVGIIATLFAPPVIRNNNTSSKNLSQLIIESFLDFLLRKKAWLILLLIITYKLGDAFSHALSTTFLLDLEFSLTEVGIINKVLGVIATLCGVLVGGLFMTRVGLYKALLTFGVLAAVANLTYMLLAMTGKNLEIACAAVFVENVCAGMGTAAFVALLMSLCNPKYTATQFALLSSLAALGRVYVGPISGYLVQGIGWAGFYCFSAAAAVPGLLLLIYLRSHLDSRSVTADKTSSENLDMASKA